MTAQKHWSLLVLDAAPPADVLTSLTTADIDGDGHQEILSAGEGALLWYRPDTFEKGVIDEGRYGVGLITADVDGDGELEIVCSRLIPEPWNWQLVYYKRSGDGWARHLIDEQNDGGAHDILFVDIDGDGEKELIANAAYCKVPGLYIHKRRKNGNWERQVVIENLFAEGLAVADLDGDGNLEIIHGPDYFKRSKRSSGHWTRTTYAPSFREMCRVTTLDISGRGSPDILIVDSEYMDGKLSWFENKLAEGKGFIEHIIETPVIYAHSLSAWLEDAKPQLFLAEMAQGGWDPPYNWDARLMRFSSADNGASWQREILDRGQGTHEAEFIDINGDGLPEVVGKEVWRPRVHVWQQLNGESPTSNYRHRFIDRDKPRTGTDIVAVDLTGDGADDVVCAAWWYKNPGNTTDTWERFELPGIYQIICAYDIDNDGQPELIGTRVSDHFEEGNDYSGLSSKLCWLKARDIGANKWDVYDIGEGTGDWPHGNCVAPFLPNGRLALAVSYHSAHAGDGHVPEIFEIPNDPTQPWPKRELANIKYGEELVPLDLTGNGELDIVAGTHWLENAGDGTFTPHKLISDPDFYPARLRVFDIDGDGQVEVVMGEEKLDYETQSLPFSKLATFKPGEDIRQPWHMHVIDTLRCPHSVEVMDVDGDGELEVLAGEHDPFWPYRNRSRLYVYKKANAEATAFYRTTLDSRFEHHDGVKQINLSGGRKGVISHGWNDSIYVNLWEETEANT